VLNYQNSILFVHVNLSSPTLFPTTYPHLLARRVVANSGDSGLVKVFSPRIGATPKDASAV